MQYVKRSPAVKGIILSSLLLVVCSDPGADSHLAQTRSTPTRRTSPDLRQPVRDSFRFGDARLVGDGIMVGDVHLVRDAGENRAQPAMVK
jgi:hypothetical protein